MEIFGNFVIGKWESCRLKTVIPDGSDVEQHSCRKLTGDEVNVIDLLIKNLSNTKHIQVSK